MATDRRRKTDEKVKPFRDVEFRKPSFDVGPLLDRRRFEANLIRYGLLPRVDTIETNINNITETTNVIQQTIVNPAVSCYWDKVGDDVWYIHGDVYCGYNLIIENLSNSANPTLKIINNSDTAYDPIIQFAVGATPVVKYTMGYDGDFGGDLTICSGSSLVETYAAGLLVDVYADNSWIDVYPSVEVYNSLYAGDPNGNGDATYIYLASYNSSDVLLASLDMSFSPNGEVDIRANNVAGGGTGQIDLMANYAGILTDGNVSGGDYISIFANSGGLIEISTGEAGDDIAWMDMESASDSGTGRAYFYFDATDYYFDGTTFNLGRGAATTRHAQFNFINHTGGANYNYVGLQAPDAVATSFTLTLPITDSTGTQALVSNGSGVLSWATFLSSVTAHNVLSSTHGDSTAAAVARGSLIVGQGATPKWASYAKGTTGYFLKATVDDAVWAAHGLTYSDVGAEVSGATATHAALITGIHGLVITAGQTLTLTTSLTNNTGAGTLTWPAAGATLTIPTGGGTLGTAAFTAATAYEASGAVSSHAALITGVHGLVFTAGKALTLTESLTLNALPVGGLAVATAANTLGSLAVGLTTQILVGGGAATVPAWGTDIPTAVTIGSAYIYRASGTDVPVADGGTGLSAGTSGGILGYTAAGTLASSAALTDSVLLVGGGAGATPTSLVSGLGATTQYLRGNAGGEATWETLNQAAVAGLTTSDGPTFDHLHLTTDLPVSEGGTGASTFALNGILYGNAANAVGVTAIGVQYNVLTVGASPFVPAWSGYLLSGTSGGKTTFAVTGTKTLTLTATDDYNLTVAATASISGTNTGDNSANSLYDIGSDTQAWSAVLDTVTAGTYLGDDSITTLGTIATGSWHGTAIAADHGGTGATTLADGGLVIGNAAGAVEVVAAGTTLQILVGGGAATAPVWGTDIPTAVTIGTKYIYRAEGTDVPVADGGTGASTFTDHGVLYGQAANAIGATAEGATGTYLAGTTGAAPGFATLNQAAIDGLKTTQGPTFAHLHISDLAAITTAADSWIGPSETDGLHFNGANLGLGGTPVWKFHVHFTSAAYNAADYNIGSLRLTTNAGTGLFSGIGFGAGGAREAFFGVIEGASSGLGHFVWQGYDSAGGVYKEYMRLTASGNVGIGMTPTYTLDVTGNIRCSTGFGCNSKTPQTAYASGGAVNTGTVDTTWGSAEVTVVTSMRTLCDNIRLALIANGIMS